MTCSFGEVQKRLKYLGLKIISQVTQKGNKNVHFLRLSIAETQPY